MYSKHKLSEIKGTVNYKGVLVSKLIGGYEVLGEKVKTPSEVDNVIEKAKIHLKNSITVVNKGQISCQNHTIPPNS